MIAHDAFVVVGKSFAEFSEDKPALTLSQLDALLQLPPNLLAGRKRLLLGQGVNEQECRKVLQRLSATPDLDARFDASHLHRLVSRAPQALSHKRKPVNTLISQPEQIESDLYSLSLLVDEDSELMGDHQTGQHIQGMVQIEALRQSFLAVTEAFYPTPWDGPSYFVINGMDVSFQNFLFPLPAEIRYRSIEADVTERRARHVAEMEVRQSGQICSSCTTKFAVYPSSVIAEKEAKLASSATAEFLRQFAQPNAVEAADSALSTVAAE